MDWIRPTTTLLLLSGALFLAYEPLLWLLGSWYMPGYPRSGGVVFGLVLALFGYSLSSPRVQRGSDVERRRSIGLGLLLLSAGVRAAAQVADINLLGALVLVVDVYAIALLIGTGVRQRAVAPFWLACVFCFCLPLEPWLQRLLGTPLQWLSAQSACGLLTLAVNDVVCDGLRLWVADVEVLVDLACSGSQLLVQASLLQALLFACMPPTWRRVASGVVLSLFLVWLLNGWRIALLALGLAYRPWGLDVMAPNWHSAIGLFCFAVLALTLMMVNRSAWQHYLQGAAPQVACDLPRRVARSLEVNPSVDEQTAHYSRRSVVGAVAFLSLALVIVQLEAAPLDRTANLAAPYLPAVLAGQSRETGELTSQEQIYYQTYGGAAVKASYGRNGLLLVRTGAPIRHLHAPDVCLGGMGFDVAWMGTDTSSVPTAVYRAQRKSTGETWQVRVSYVSDTGAVTASLSQLAWLWLAAPSTRWTMVQRLVPWGVAEHLTDKGETIAAAGQPAARLVPQQAAAWDQAVLRAFNLYTPTRATTLSAAVTAEPNMTCAQCKLLKAK